MAKGTSEIGDRSKWWLVFRVVMLHKPRAGGYVEARVMRVVHFDFLVLGFVRGDWEAWVVDCRVFGGCVWGLGGC